jgi:hypothetical protein
MSEGFATGFVQGTAASQDMQLGEGNDLKKQDLSAATAERGIALPPGLRSKAAQDQALNGLIRRNPDLTADEIADKVRSSEPSFKAHGYRGGVKVGVPVSQSN